MVSKARAVIRDASSCLQILWTLDPFCPACERIDGDHPGGGNVRYRTLHVDRLGQAEIRASGTVFVGDVIQRKRSGSSRFPKRNHRTIVVCEPGKSSHWCPVCTVLAGPNVICHLRDIVATGVAHEEACLLS